MDAITGLVMPASVAEWLSLAKKSSPNLVHMATAKQELGDFGEKAVAANVKCPGCKRTDRTIRLLPTNFKCADLVCDFCGYLAQVKSMTAKNPEIIPRRVLGAAWKPQLERMEASIYFPLYIVLVESTRNFAIYFLPRELQTREMFIPRKPLSSTAKRAGWQGYEIDLTQALGLPTQVFAKNTSKKQ